MRWHGPPSESSDPTALVDEQVRDGHWLIEALRDAGFPVRAAGWLRESDGGQWFLYVVTPEVDARGAREAYGAMNAVDWTMGPLWVGPFEIKLVGVDDSVSRNLEAVHRGYARPGDVRLPGSLLGGVPIGQAVVYALPAKTPKNGDYIDAIFSVFLGTETHRH